MAKNGRANNLKQGLRMLGMVFGLATVLAVAGYAGKLGSLQNQVQAAGDRPRVKLGVDGYLVTGDTNWPLRGDNPRWQGGNTTSLWTTLKRMNMNTARVLVYREHSITYGWDSPNANTYSASDADANGDLQLSVGPGSEQEVYKTKIMNEMIATLDKWVNDAATNGMYLIIDYHPVGGYEEFDAREWWKIIAPRYQNRTHVIYELSNEPVSWSAADYYHCNDNSLFDPATCTRSSYARRIRDYKYKTPIDWQVALYKQIRQAAPNTHIILWSFANGFGDMVGVANAGKNKGISYSNASVSYHMYGKNETAIRNLKTSYNVIVSEMGADTAEEYNTKVATAERVGTKSWILLDGIDPSKQVSVTWGCDPYFCGGIPTSTPGATATRTPTPRPTTTPIPQPGPTATPRPSAIPTPTSGAGTGNMLVNGSFESNPQSNSDYFTVTDDTASGRVVFTWESTGYFGSRSAGIAANNVASTVLSRWLSQHNPSRQIAVTPGKTYRGEAWIKTENVTNNSNITLVYWGPGVYDLAGVKTSTTVRGTSGWVMRSVEMVAPASARYVRFEMRQVGPGRSWFDGAILAEK